MFLSLPFVLQRWEVVNQSHEPVPTNNLEKKKYMFNIITPSVTAVVTT